jgi:hypothetical protein
VVRERGVFRPQLLELLPLVRRQPRFLQPPFERLQPPFELGDAFGSVLGRLDQRAVLHFQHRAAAAE